MNGTERNRLRRVRHKQYVENYKQAHNCTECGTTQDLTFHHLRPKSFNISGNMSKSLLIIKGEIEKCVVLCLKCHRELHHREDLKNGKDEILE